LPGLREFFKHVQQYGLAYRLLEHSRDTAKCAQDRTCFLAAKNASNRCAFFLFARSSDSMSIVAIEGWTQLLGTVYAKGNIEQGGNRL
jgi:hypothetical protein